MAPDKGPLKKKI